MNKIFTALFLSTALASTGVCLAATGDEPSMRMVSSAYFGRPHNRHPFPGSGRIISDYIEEQAKLGTIDPSAFNRLQEQQQALRGEIKSLRESGDLEGAKAKLQDMRALHQNRREWVRNLIDNNDDLRGRLTQHRRQVQDRRRERHQRFRDLRRDHREFRERANRGGNV